MSFTIIIVAITVGLSLAAFNNINVYNKLILWPREMDNNPAEYHRLLSSGFIHADYMHLGFNMFALYSFGTNVEMIFGAIGKPAVLYLWLYLSGIVIASLPSFMKNRHNSMYRSLGASGGVASIMFFMIYFFPWSSIQFIIIPGIDIPSIVFGVLYLIFEAYMSRKGTSNINHSAHFWGSAYGLLFAFAVDPTHGRMFVQQMMNYHF